MGATLSSLCSTGAERSWLDPVDRKQFTYIAFCYRVRAIATLYEVKIGSASDADNTQWKQISDKIRKYDDEMSDKTLKELREELEKSRDSTRAPYRVSSIVKRIKIVSDAFDTGLLSHLQAKVVLMEKLGDCLPNKRQSWEEFVMDRNEELDPTNAEPSAEPEVLEKFKDLTRMLMSAIEGVDEYVKKSGVSQSVQKEKKIKVFYATDRSMRKDRYTSEQGKCLLYGFQQVSIPDVHKRGKVECPNMSGQGNDSEHFMLKAKRGPWSKWDEFLKQIKKPSQDGHSATDIASSTGGPQEKALEVLLYIHGYTVSYNSALKHVAQLKNDLEFEGLVILYSWRTMGQPLAYHRDGRAIEGTAEFLSEFITTILGEEDSFSKVHILAHSMGNRALIEVLTKPWWNPLSNAKLSNRRGVLKNVILAAADEELHKFEEMLGEMMILDPVRCPLISVCSSARDWPLFVSGYINWQSRLGNTVSLFANHSMRRWDHMVDMIDTHGVRGNGLRRWDHMVDVIDASGVRCNSLRRWDRMVDVIDASGVRCNSLLKHSYHAEAPEVLNDIQKLLTEQKRAGERPVIEPLLHDSGRVFHAFVPSWWDQSRFNGCVKRIQNQARPTTVTDG